MKNQDRHVASVQCHGRGDSLNLKSPSSFRRARRRASGRWRLGAACSARCRRAAGVGGPGQRPAWAVTVDRPVLNGLTVACPRLGPRQPWPA